MPAQSAPVPVISVSPVTLPAPGRAVAMQVRISAPLAGQALPVVLLSHGHGRSNFLSSLHGYGPLANYYAAHGFVVVQPTHLSSKSLALPTDGPEGPLYWRSRADDMRFLLDHAAELEAAVPGLGGRVDWGRAAVVGHSLGGHTAALLAGMQVTDPAGGEPVSHYEPRLRAAVLLTAPGAGAGLTGPAGTNYPVLRQSSFAEMRLPTLVVIGDQDVNPMFAERAEWRADAYHLGPGPGCLLTVFGAGHGLGGIAGYDAAETTDEDPARVALVGQLTTAYLRTTLYPEDDSWPAAQQALARDPNPPARIECK